jgi:hypothetical protein
MPSTRGTGRLGSTHFHLERQVAMIEQHGSQTTVFPCLQCPCLTLQGHPDPNCFACAGVGRFYPPDTSFHTMMLLTWERSQRTFQETGYWLSGRVRASLLPGIHVAEGDKVRVLSIKDTFSDEVLTRHKVEDATKETLRFSAGVELLLVADRVTKYTPDVDYTLTPPNIITWVPGGHAPLVGAKYTVRYNAYPEFLSLPDTPKLRVEHQRPQSQFVMLRRLDKLTPEDS